MGTSCCGTASLSLFYSPENYRGYFLLTNQHFLFKRVTNAEECDATKAQYSGVRWLNIKKTFHTIPTLQTPGTTFPVLNQSKIQFCP